ncbi:hypothetical protein KP79_PYT25050 [Mizuhopecten yessoensis]|uniref:Uncharacterized protein n=1 Tax=Mizuhopecten yessoensis TaxID=6573 RepID=A0A210PY79_MIZYE|nr:hypothetical protein KP79_PYT25050 [Mizuhopecten yessoensis]
MNARFHGAVLTGNNGVGNSLMTKMKCIGATVAPEVRHSLQQIQAEQDYHQKFQKRTLELKAEAIQRHIQNKGARSDYKQGQLDNPPDLRTSRLSSNNDEHNYHK